MKSLQQWSGSLSLIGAGIFVSALQFRGDDAVVAAIVLVAFGSLAWWSSPWRGPHVSHEQAQAAATANDVIVYWRPG